MVVSILHLLGEILIEAVLDECWQGGIYGRALESVYFEVTLIVQVEDS
jgi:hypothetical protein